MAGKNKGNTLYEIDFYEKVLQRAPNFLEALICLGDLYTKEGMFEKGLIVDLRLAQLRPEDPVILYNLACSHSLLNNIALASSTMVRAIELGYDEWDHLKNDPDLVNLWGDPQFREYVDRYQKKALRPRAFLKNIGA